MSDPDTGKVIPEESEKTRANKRAKLASSKSSK